MKKNSLSTMMGGTIPKRLMPQNLFLNSGNVFEDFEDKSNWTQQIGTVEDNTSEYITGLQSIKQTTALGSECLITKTINQSMQYKQPFRIYIYNHGNTDLYGNAGFTWVYFASVSDFSKYAQTTIDSKLHTGWNTINKTSLDAWTLSGEDFTDPIVRLRFTLRATVNDTQPSWSYDTMRTGFESIPAVIISFDDAYDGVYTLAYPTMEKYNIKGTVYMTSNLIDTNNYLSAQQLVKLNSNGWDIGNHGETHVDLTELTEEQVTTNLTNCKNTLDALGCTRASMHLAYPNGEYNTTVISGAVNAGILSARTIESQRNPIIPRADWHTIESKPITSNINLTTAKGYIDNAIDRKEVCFLYFHNIVSSGASGDHWNLSDFSELIDYIRSKNLQPLTISQFYNLQTGNVYVDRLK